MENLPGFVAVLFILITIVTAGFLYRAGARSAWFWILISIWLFVHAVAAFKGFYEARTIPPRFAILGGIPALFIIGLFISNNGRKFIDTLDIKWLTLLHIIRIAVELIFIRLLNHHMIPQIMTFEGRVYWSRS